MQYKPIYKKTTLIYNKCISKLNLSNICFTIIFWKNSLDIFTVREEQKLTDDVVATEHAAQFGSGAREDLGSTPDEELITVRYS